MIRSDLKLLLSIEAVPFQLNAVLEHNKVGRGANGSGSHAGHISMDEQAVN